MDIPLQSLLYLIIPFITVALGSFLYKKAQMLGIKPGSFMVVQAFSFFLTIITAILWRGKSIQFNPDQGFGILAGFFGITGALASLISLKKGELGINIVIVRLSFIPTVLGGIFLLNEIFTMRKALIIVLGIISIFLFIDHYRRHNPIAISSLIPAGIACLAFGCFDLIYKTASLRNVDPLMFIFFQTLTGNILINIYVLIFEKHTFNKTILIIAPVCGFLFASASLAFLKALSYVDVSLVSPVLQMNFVLSYIMGVIFLNESITKRKIFGIGCVIICIILLSI